MSDRVDCTVLADAEAVTRVAAETIVQAVRLAVAARSRAVLALSGGGTPEPLYRLLASPAYDELVPWSGVHLVWGDERLVPPDREGSNYRMAAETGLLDRPLAGVHRMPGELEPAAAAARYADVLAELWPGGAPRIDLALQGMGDDGHTASLFPRGEPTVEARGWVGHTEEHAGFRRLTLTLPVLAGSRRVLFLVTGEGKAGALRRVLVDRDASLPAFRLTREASRVTWLADRRAAAELPRGRGEDASPPLCR